MKTRIAQTKVFVQTHKTKLAAIAGVAVGAAAVYWHYNQDTYLQITDEEFRLMDEYDAVGTYHTEHGKIRVHMIDD